MRFKIAVLLLLYVLASSCVENPFFGKNDQPQLKLKVTGTVLMENEIDHSDIFVWIEGFDIGTKTDSKGDFKLTLTNPELLSGGALAWNGVFKIYYYVANFKYVVSEVLIKNGEFVFDRYDLTEKGELKDNIKLKPLVKIETILWPDIPIYEKSFEQKMRVTINITRMTSEPVTYTSYVGDNGGVMSYFLKRVDGPVGKSYTRLHDYPAFVYNEILTGPLESEIEIISAFLSPGKYIAVPYFVIKQQNLPTALIKNISEFANTLTLEFLKVPLRIESTELVVLER